MCCNHLKVLSGRWRGGDSWVTVTADFNRRIGQAVSFSGAKGGGNGLSREVNNVVMELMTSINSTRSMVQCDHSERTAKVNANMKCSRLQGHSIREAIPHRMSCRIHACHRQRKASRPTTEKKERITLALSVMLSQNKSTFFLFSRSFPRF